MYLRIRIRIRIIYSVIFQTQETSAKTISGRCRRGHLRWIQPQNTYYWFNTDVFFPWISRQLQNLPSCECAVSFTYPIIVFDRDHVSLCQAGKTPQTILKADAKLSLFHSNIIKLIINSIEYFPELHTSATIKYTRSINRLYNYFHFT